MSRRSVKPYYSGNYPNWPYPRDVEEAIREIKEIIFLLEHEGRWEPAERRWMYLRKAKLLRYADSGGTVGLSRSERDRNKEFAERGRGRRYDADR